MSIRDEEERLFDEWKKVRKNFVRDGVVSEPDYQTSNPQIAIILKEVNAPDGRRLGFKKILVGGSSPEDLG